MRAKLTCWYVPLHKVYSQILSILFWRKEIHEEIRAGIRWCSSKMHYFGKNIRVRKDRITGGIKVEDGVIISGVLMSQGVERPNFYLWWNWLRDGRWRRGSICLIFFGGDLICSCHHWYVVVAYLQVYFFDVEVSWYHNQICHFWYQL